MMGPTSKQLTIEEYASLLKVANTNAVLKPSPVIPVEHSARLIELGYVADVAGRLRMTGTGRYRVAVGENQGRPAPKGVD
jgi:hypothetical protein